MKGKTIGFLLTAKLMLSGNSLFAQKEKSTATTVIKISSQCDMCKKRIETGLLYMPGVKNATVTVATSTIEVKYKKSKTNLKELEKAIAAIGYDANDLPADTEAYNNLPKCCQKGGH